MTALHHGIAQREPPSAVLPPPGQDRAGGFAAVQAGPVLVMLSTMNGARFLQAQLDSLLQQTHTDWTLLWRDDGSDDGTEAVMARFAAGPGHGRCTRLAEPAGRMGAAASFMALLRAAQQMARPASALAFADQDDVWLPDKLARGLAALDGVPPGVPALYCGRQMLVDQRLRHLGLSLPVQRPPGFPAALTQNIATGCTVMLNPAAAALVGASRPPAATLHDWWCYILVTAAGGRLLVDPEPVILYRQHGTNLVGAPSSRPRRAWAALRRGPRTFMAVFRQHVDALAAQPQLLSPPARTQVAEIGAALHGGMLPRVRALRMLGLHRQTWPETLLFRWWFMIG